MNKFSSYNKDTSYRRNKAFNNRSIYHRKPFISKGHGRFGQSQDSFRSEAKGKEQYQTRKYQKNLSGNPQDTKVHQSTKKARFGKLLWASLCRQNKKLSFRMGKANQRSIYSPISSRLPNRVGVSGVSAVAVNGAKTVSHERETIQSYTRRNTQYAKERSNKASGGLPQANYLHDLCHTQEVRGIPSRFQLKETQSVHQIQTLQNGISEHGQTIDSKRRLDGLHRSEGCLFYDSTLARPQEISEVRMGRQVTGVSSGSVWFEVGSSPIHKAHETSHFSPTTEVNEVDHLLGRPTPDSSVRERMSYPEAIHSAIIREAGSVSKLGKISVGPMSQDSFSGAHDRFPQYDVEPPRREGHASRMFVQTNNKKA